MRETEVGEDGYAAGRLEVADITHVADEGEIELVALTEGRLAAKELNQFFDNRLVRYAAEVGNNGGGIYNNINNII